MRSFFILLILMVCYSGCLQQGVDRRSFFQTAYDEVTPTDEQTPTPIPTSTPESDPLILSSEIRHFVDPYTGNYKTKVTIPKNYHGLLYLSGLNITALSNRLIKVRFKFGRDLAIVDVPAVVAQGTGMTPQTQIQVLVMDFRDRPFENLRLLYDLFDYNSYDSNSTPTNDPYNDKLYCRGLTLDYDPTFESDKTKCSAYTNGDCPYSLSDCDYPEDKCYYAFAKIRDSGLYSSDGYATFPSEAQIDINKGDFNVTETDVTQLDQYNEINLKKCLPDNGTLFYRKLGAQNFLHLTYLQSSLYSAATIGQEVMTRIVDEKYSNYKYQGPYRLLSQNSWALKKGAAVGPHGLFEDTFDGDATKVSEGVHSFLFPRSTKISLSANIEHLASSSAWVTKGQTRAIKSLLDSGDTVFMDGCNWRVMNYDSVRNEGVSSCNVTATVEIVTVDPESNSEIILDSSKKVKLQIIRPSETNDEGNEVLYQSLKSCTTSRTCQENECCFNRRCWSKELVGQCSEEASSEGQKEVGALCSTDYECLTLCCDPSLGRCAVHDTTLTEPVYCGKPPGSYCVAKEWCRKDIITDCRIVKTGVSPTGQVTCTLRCYNRLEHGDCVNGQCVAPKNPTIPSFDQTKPDCSQAQDPPVILKN